MWKSTMPIYQGKTGIKSYFEMLMKLNSTWQVIPDILNFISVNAHLHLSLCFKNLSYATELRYSFNYNNDKS